MRAFLRIFFLFALLLPSRQELHAAVVKMDTSKVQVKKPSPEKEQEVFSDSKFDYGKDASYSESPLQRFFSWLLRKLFGAATHENASLFWSIVRVILIVAVITLVIFLLFKTEIRRLFSGKPAETEIHFSDIPENINELNIDQLIRDASQKHDYRLATRWGYLKLLKQLSQKELIRWKPYKTNFEYYAELKHELLRQEFRNVSHVYEHVWYGDFTIDETVYSRSAEEFRRFEQSVNNINSYA